MIQSDVCVERVLILEGTNAGFCVGIVERDDLFAYSISIHRSAHELFLYMSLEFCIFLPLFVFSSPLILTSIATLCIVIS